MLAQINQGQVLAAVRWLITVVGSYAVGRGYVTTDQVATIGGIAMAIAPLVWAMFAHSEAGAVHEAGHAITRSDNPDVAARPLLNAMQSAGVATVSYPPEK